MQVQSMTPYEHYEKAEEILKALDQLDELIMEMGDQFSSTDTAKVLSSRDYSLKLAQVHATLATVSRL